MNQLENFEYLKDICDEVLKRYNLTSFETHFKSNKQKIEIKFNLPIYKQIKIKSNSVETNLQVQLRIIDSIDHKIALRLEFLVYLPYNDSYYLLDLNRKIKITHRGSNFDNDFKSPLVNNLPTEKEIRSLLDLFVYKYQTRSKVNINDNQLTQIIDEITDSFLRKMFVRKLRCSKHFSISKIYETVTFDESIKVDEEKIPLENVLNCYHECLRPAPADSLKRSINKFEKILKKYL